jgi:hypothetical protein
MDMRVAQRAIVFLLAAIVAPGIIRAQAQGSGQRSTQVPAAVYSRLFREVVNSEAQADRLVARGQSDAAVRHHHQIWLGLSSDQEAKLKQVAADWSSQNAPLDAQASYERKALQELRGARSTADVAAQTQELAAIAAQQVALVRSARKSLATGFGPARYAYFESLVRRFAAPKAPTAPRPRDCAEPACPAPGGETSQLDTTDNWTYFSDGSCCRTGGEYEGVLDATPSANFTGRWVDEDFGGADDGCYPLFGQAAGVNQFSFEPDGPWEVGTKYQDDSALARNHYGLDYVWIDSWVAFQYLYIGMAEVGVTASCSINAIQSLYADDCNDGWEPEPYQSQPIGISITRSNTQVCATRASWPACAQM